MDKEAGFLIAGIALLFIAKIAPSHAAKFWLPFLKSKKETEEQAIAAMAAAEAAQAKAEREEQNRRAIEAEAYRIQDSLLSGNAKMMHEHSREIEARRESEEHIFQLEQFIRDSMTYLSPEKQTVARILVPQYRTEELDSIGLTPRNDCTGADGDARHQ